jgi:Fungal specific transcription factor domain
MYSNDHWDAPSFQDSGHDRWDINSSYAYASPESFPGASRYDQEGIFELDDDVEEIVRSGSFSTSIASGRSLVRSRSQYPDLAMISPSPVASPLLEFSAPVFMEFSEKRSRRALVDHFCNVLSHLVVFKEDTGNPFQQLVLPLSHKSSPVLNAIFALSSAHLEYRGVVNEEKSLNFHNRALRGLATLIDENQNANREEVLAAIMLLIYYEVVSQPIEFSPNGGLKSKLARSTQRFEHCS